MSQFSPPLTPAVISSNSSTPPSLTSPATALSTPHLDYIHDLQYDFYGRRLATCSGDSTLTIYSLSPSNTWLQNPGSTWQAHKGVVWSVSWAHPEYGQLIVSAGADHMVHVWEEQSSAESGGGKSKSGVKWVQKAQLTEARKAVNCVEFAPRHGGLRLAAGSADGVVRIYEAIDVMNLNHWPMSQCFDADVSNSELGVTSLSWCAGRYEPPLLAVGGSSGSVSVWQFSENNRAWSVAYSLPSHNRGVLDVKWAPNVGRSFHLIASTGKDGLVRVNKLKRKKGDGEGATAEGSVVEFDGSVALDNKEAAWRLGWNVTGTVLACSGDSGVVSLWRARRGEEGGGSEGGEQAPLGEEGLEEKEDVWVCLDNV